MLVMIALIVSATVGYSYLASQGSAISIGRNIREQAQARYAAECGLEVAIAAIKGNSNWRTQRPNGTWLASQSVSGGTYTILGQDGADANGDGLVTIPGEGDGSLSDDANDPVTLTVTGRYANAAQVLTAVVRAESGAGESVKYGYETLTTTAVDSIPLVQFATRMTVSQPGDLTSISIYADSSNPSSRVRMGLYDDNHGEPDNRLAQTSTKAVGPGGPHWVTADINGSPVKLEAGQYWLAFGFEDFGMHCYCDTDGGQARLLIWEPISLGLTPTWFYNLADLPYAVKAYISCTPAGYAIDLK